MLSFCIEIVYECICLKDIHKFASFEDLGLILDLSEHSLNCKVTDKNQNTAAEKKENFFITDILLIFE